MKSDFVFYSVHNYYEQSVGAVPGQDPRAGVAVTAPIKRRELVDGTVPRVEPQSNERRKRHSLSGRV